MVNFTKILTGMGRLTTQLSIEIQMELGQFHKKTGLMLRYTERSNDPLEGRKSHSIHTYKEVQVPQHFNQKNIYF